MRLGKRMDVVGHRQRLRLGEEEWCGWGRKTKALSFYFYHMPFKYTLRTVNTSDYLGIMLAVINFNGSYLLAPI